MRGIRYRAVAESEDGIGRRDAHAQRRELRLWRHRAGAQGARGASARVAARALGWLADWMAASRELSRPPSPPLLGCVSICLLHVPHCSFPFILLYIRFFGIFVILKIKPMNQQQIE